jgi:hypothetical protein
MSAGRADNHNYVGEDAVEHRGNYLVLSVERGN